MQWRRQSSPCSLQQNTSSACDTDNGCDPKFSFIYVQAVPLVWPPCRICARPEQAKCPGCPGPHGIRLSYVLHNKFTDRSKIFASWQAARILAAIWPKTDMYGLDCSGQACIFSADACSGLAIKSHNLLNLWYISDVRRRNGSALQAATIPDCESACTECRPVLLKTPFVRLYNSRGHKIQHTARADRETSFTLFLESRLRGFQDNFLTRS